jgi:hypothetical protein
VVSGNPWIQSFNCLSTISIVLGFSFLAICGEGMAGFGEEMASCGGGDGGLGGGGWIGFVWGWLSGSVGVAYDRMIWGDSRLFFCTVRC